MQPFFKLRLACAISTLPTTQAPRRLYYAARAGYVGAIKQLLAHGASATKEGYGGLAPLHHALIHLREPACHALLEAGADPNQADSGGHTALSIAKRMGYSSIVALLEQHQR